jgi:hypothetical protein
MEPRPSVISNLNNNMVQITTFNIADDGWTVILAMSGTVSIFSTIDTRLSIALTTDLQLTTKNLLIVDGRQERSYMLGNYPLDNEIQIQSEVSDQFHTEFRVSARCRAGLLVLKRPSDSVVEWVSLASDLNVRNIRLRLSLRERKYLGDGKWGISIADLPVESHTCWSCKLLFAKRTH